MAAFVEDDTGGVKIVQHASPADGSPLGPRVRCRQMPLYNMHHRYPRLGVFPPSRLCQVPRAG